MCWTALRYCAGRSGATSSSDSESAPSLGTTSPVADGNTSAGSSSGATGIGSGVVSLLMTLTYPEVSESEQCALAANRPAHAIVEKVAADG